MTLLNARLIAPRDLRRDFFELAVLVATLQLLAPPPLILGSSYTTRKSGSSVVVCGRGVGSRTRATGGARSRGTQTRRP